MTSTLRDLMEHAVGDVAAPASILNRAVRAGQQRRARRRLGLATAALVATASATAGIAIGAGSHAGPTSVATDPHGPRPHLPRFAPTPGWWDMPAGTMAERLKRLLPNGVRITSWVHVVPDPAPGQSNAMKGELDAVLRSKEGRGSVEISLIQRPDQLPPSSGNASDTTFALSCPPPGEAVNDVQSCAGLMDTATGELIGRTLQVEQGGVIMREVKRLSPDGMIRVEEANSVQYKWGSPASAPQPLLTLEQLEAIAKAATWQDYTPAPSPSA